MKLHMNYTIADLSDAIDHVHADKENLTEEQFVQLCKIITKKRKIYEDCTNNSCENNLYRLCYRYNVSKKRKRMARSSKIYLR